MNTIKKESTKRMDERKGYMKHRLTSDLRGDEHPRVALYLGKLSHCFINFK